MKKYLKCLIPFNYKGCYYYEVGKVYIYKQTSFNQSTYIVGGTLLLKENEIKKHFEKVEKNDDNKILCLKDYFHNNNRCYTSGYDYYLYEINWEKNEAYLSSKFRSKIVTELSIIKEHFDLTHILRKRKIENFLNESF